MKMRVVELNEETRIPLKLVLTIAGSLVGFSAWLTTIAIEQNAQGKQIIELKGHEEVKDNVLQNLTTDTAVIKESIKHIEEMLREQKRSKK